MPVDRPLGQFNHVLPYHFLVCPQYVPGEQGGIFYLVHGNFLLFSRLCCCAVVLDLFFVVILLTIVSTLILHFFGMTE
jgi:hypothetical protein